MKTNHNTKLVNDLRDCIESFIKVLDANDISEVAAGIIGVGVLLKDGEIQICKTLGSRELPSSVDRQNGVSFYIWLPYLESVRNDFELLYDSQGDLEDSSNTDSDRFFASLKSRRDELFQSIMKEFADSSYQYQIECWADEIERIIDESDY